MQSKEVIDKANTLRLALSFILEESDFDLTILDDVEGINDVVEAQPCRHITKLVLGDLYSVELAAGLKKLA